MSIVIVHRLVKNSTLSRISSRRNDRSLVVHTRKRHPNRALTEPQIRNLLSAIENIHDDALIRLGLSVGLRVSEVVISLYGSLLSL
jgi:integrase